MKHKRDITILDILMFIVPIVAIFLFALTFKAHFESHLSFQIRITSTLALIISLVYFGLTRHTIRQDINIILLLLTMALFLIYFRFF